MDWIEVGKTIANLGLIPALGVACIVIWRQWWLMVGELKTAYDAVIARLEGHVADKDKRIRELTQKVEDLGEKRLEEYRKVIVDYRNTLDETNRRDGELAGGQKVTTQLLQQLLSRGGA